MLNGEQILDHLRTVVDEAGEYYVDPNSTTIGGCKYAQNGKPMCIAGRVLFRAGVSVEMLEYWDTQPNNTIEQLWDKGNLHGLLEQHAMNILNTAQDNQDVGCNWGTVLASAEAYATNYHKEAF